MEAYDGRSVVVAGAGISGAAAARVLRDRGATVTVVDARGGADVLVTDVVPAATDLVVTSPGWRPDAPLLLDAATKGIEVVGEVELAWRLRPAGAAPWLAVTGTNGKTTSVKMLASILTAAGHRTVAAGNVGLPLLDAVLDPSYDVLAVELSSFQLHWSSSLRPVAGALLNVAPDHLDWHGSMRAYAAAKARIWAGETSIGNADDEVTRTLLQRAPGRRVAFTLRTPRPGELGLVEDLLVDRAFADLPGEATELASLSDLTVPGAHNVANALAAAALARAYGVAAADVRAGLRAFVADPHRNALVATVDGVDWVDDSKATNPHAAAASLAAYDRIV
jgi:UDP-N-acetylmuramoylalanine--D-glutamate ligase